MQPVFNDGELLACATDAARAAGSHALANYERRREVIQRSAHDVKLKLDVECQAVAERTIRNHFPDHNILGEEGGMFRSGVEPLWIVDPIDGTVNFTHGLPLWCSSVAVRVGAEMVAGAVFMPQLGELYTATRTGPARMNGATIQVSDTPSLAEAMIVTGLSKHLGDDVSMLGVFEALSLRAQKIRLMGAAAVDICHVACGRADGYYESSIHLWDIAAAALIAERAGARVEILDRMSDVKFRFLCSNGRFHEELRSVIQQAMPA